MRYLLVDRIVDWQQGESIKGIKSVAMSEDFLEYHFPKTPVMPGVLLLEALVQLAGWLEAASSNFENWFLLNQVERSLFYGFALPGDRVELEVQAKSSPLSVPRMFTGSCSVDGKKRMAAEFAGEIVRLGDIEDVEEQKRVFRSLTRDESRR
jgi:3-hydroxyacyl-[acyl-carrier-protein] dehydratase